tara:strand:- start:813 stop:1496 length:684 start_codon:yes stop_codon:yes gene_type:complete
MYLFTNAYYIVKVRLLSCATIYAKQIENKTGTLLDLGSGASPYNTLYNPDIDIITLEYNADRRPSVVADAHFLPFKNDAFDYITSYEVLEHVRDPQLVIAEIHRILKSSGTCAISVPMTWGLHYEPYDFRRFTNHGLIAMLEDNDFNIKLVRKIGGLYSFFFARNLDIIYTFIRKLPIINMIPYRGHILAILFSPLSLFLSISCYALDAIAKDDAIGWFVIFDKDLS